jgi:Stress responsive A/B Barrel Domain
LNKSSGLQHIVLFSFPRPLDAGEAEQMRAMVASWPAEIGLMTKCRFGTDITGARNRGYSYLLYTEFADMETMERYRDHPVHQRFLQWITERECTPLAFDYYLDERTVLADE